VFTFAERTTCTVGRADDCSPRLPTDEHHKTISRHHCLLDINPPDIRVRDFGSLNGTFVNGTKIGQRAAGMTPEQGAQLAFPEFDLKDGDTIQLGKTVFQVGVFVPALCAECSAEIPEEHKAGCERAPGICQCAACRFKTAYADPMTTPRPKAKVCGQCGRDVSGEIGEHRQGEFVCAQCKADPARIAQHLLELSEAGDDSLSPMRGYTILKELGRGGMGAVYLARHRRTGELVALKIMLPQIAADERARQIFLREVENTKALKHRHVVWLRDAGCSHGAFFFTLEYCDGGSMEKLLQPPGQEEVRRPLPVAEAVPLILQALEGLEYAHNVFGPGKGLVHRDLKPHNLFLAGSGRDAVAKVGDFGLAKSFDDAGLSGQTRTGALLGTPAFMPRQQVVNFKYAKPEVDVWAMAASLYYLLTGSVPRDFPQGCEWWMAVLQTDAVPIRKRNPALPPKFAEVIDHALIDNPAIPFKSAAEFRQALTAAVS
jgi:serine/threonine-protein kinase